MLDLTRSTRTRVSRRIAADPTSTALLLAGPSAVDLWPGARRIAKGDGLVLVEAPVEPGADPTARVEVRAEAPRRTPTSYITTFEWTGPDLPTVTGRLTLAYAPTADGTPVTHAVLELEPTDDAPEYGPGLAALAEGFLANLARAAETRNRAA